MKNHRIADVGWNVILARVKAGSSVLGFATAGRKLNSHSSQRTTSFPSHNNSRFNWSLWATGSVLTGGVALAYGTQSDPVLCKWFTKDKKSTTGDQDINALLISKENVILNPALKEPIKIENHDAEPLKSSEVTGATMTTKIIAKSNDAEDDVNESEIHPLWRSKESRPFEKKLSDAVIFSGSSNKVLAESIADCLGSKLGRVRLKRFADGEVSLQFLDSLRGKDVYLIQATSPPVNENLMELLLMISTSRRSSAKKITAVIPYYGYARQDRKLSSRVPISAADVARMIEAMGIDRVISVDLHSGQIQGFFGPRVPVDNLEAQLIGLDYFSQKKLHKPVVVSPDAGGVYRARKFQEGFRARGAPDVGIAMLVKQRLRANEIERMDVVGNVEGCDVVIVDDMIDTAGTLCEAAHQLRKRGAKRVFAFATHGLFSGPALDRIEASVLEEVVVTDTIQLPPAVARSNRVTQLSIAVLIADAIRRIHQKESLEQLFIKKCD